MEEGVGYKVILAFSSRIHWNLLTVAKPAIVTIRDLPEADTSSQHLLTTHLTFLWPVLELAPGSYCQGTPSSHQLINTGKYTNRGQQDYHRASRLLEFLEASRDLEATHQYKPLLAALPMVPGVF